MASRSKVIANKINAKASTGPKTQIGKAIASANARRHGILSRELMLPHESQAEFDLLLSSLITELGAKGTLECALVERIAVAIWRQRRLVRAERQDIERQNEAGYSADSTSDVSGRYSREELQTDAQLIDRTLAQPYYEENLDALERELRLMAETSGLSYEEYLNNFPMLADLFPSAAALKSTFADTRGALELNVLPPAERNKWLAGIVLARERNAKLDAYRTSAKAATIPSNTESLARYQAALDNEWYKAMRAFREARQHRLSTLENVENPG